MSALKDNMRTPLARVRGLGPARSGTGHFIAQRVTAIALVPLVAWFVWALVAHAGAPYAETAAFLSHPVNATLMLIFAVVGLWHFRIGMQEVILDYVTSDGLKAAALIANVFFAVLLSAACVVAILKLAL